MKASHNAMALHGGIDQFDRDSTIVDFKAGKVGVLIATSVAARGLDVKHLILVVNFDCPNHYEDYVHRCGRTGRAGNKGYAYTFITEDQGRYAADVIKALELSGNPVPEDLQRLFNDYKAKQEAEGKKVRGGSGFSGKGFKFDEAESHLKSEKKKFQRAALGMQDSDDEDAEGDIDREIESMLAPKKRIKELMPGPSVTAQGAVGQNAVGTPGLPPGAVPLGGITGAAAPSGAVSEKLEMARMLACRINMTRTFSAPSTPAPEILMTPQSATEAMMRGQYVPELPAPVVSAKTIAEQRAEKLHLKLNYQPKIIEEEPPEPPPQRERFQKFEEELEINDFPQQARWKVTSKEAMAQISEYSEAGITVRGTYYPPGKEPKTGMDRKLYLAIESTSELAVSKARAEIIRLIKEEMVKMQHSYQPINRGRYKVL